MRIRRPAFAIVLGTVLVAGCGDDESTTGSGGGATTGSSQAGPGSTGSGATGPSGSNGAGGAASSTGPAGTGAGSGTGGGGAGGSSDLCGDVPDSDPDVGQALPERWVDTTYVEPTGATIAVAAGGDLQAAIDAAEPGDVITLEAGATFTGTFTLPNKDGDDWVTIRTATPDDAFAAPGTRVSPDDAPAMARIVAPNTQSGFVTAAGAHHFRIVGVEITPVDADALIYTLVSFGDGTQTDLGAVPHHIILDRSYVHGTEAGYAKRGVQLDCSDCAVIDSYVSDCHAEGQDAQAVAGFNGPGPIAIVNNYLEGSGENVIFGGADPAIDDLVPSDIEIRRNHFYKPLSWKVDDPSYAGIHWSVKNLLELKNAARVLIRCNVMENNWADAQVGFAVLFTPRNQDNSAPWSGVSDITFQDNILRNTGSGINVLGEDGPNVSEQTARVVVRNNLIHDVSSARFGGEGRAFQIITGTRPTDGLSIQHNTVSVEGNALLVMGDTNPVAAGFIFRANVATHGDYGIFGSGAGEGTNALETFAPGYLVTENVLIGFDEGSYPAGNFFPATADDVGFVDVEGGDYALDPGSEFAGAADDGTDLGADVAGIEALTAGVAP